MTELRREAEQLLQEEDRRAVERAKQEATNQEESRLQGALNKIKEQRRREAAEQERREHARKADEVAAKRLELEDRVESYALQLRDGLEQLKELDAEHRKELHRADRAVPHSLNNSLTTLIGGWLRDKLHLHQISDRAISPPFSTDRNIKERTLSERDPLTQMVSDGQEAS